MAKPIRNSRKSSGTAGEVFHKMYTGLWRLSTKGGTKNKKMRLIPTLAALSIAIIPLTSNGQGTKKCVPSSPSSSSAYQEFMRSDLRAKWSTKDFGPLRHMSGEDFQDCVYRGDYYGFTMIQSNTGATARAVSYLKKGGVQKALVFEVSETGPRSYLAKAFDVSGTPMFQITVTGGVLTDVQALGQFGCGGVYLRGFAQTVFATATAGPVGFAFGMGYMMFDLWDNGCL